MSERPKIYLETSVISCFVARPSENPEKAAMEEYTRRFMEEYASDCDIFVSDIVENEAKKGDTVQIEETRPLSKTKRWRVVEIVAKGSGSEVAK